MYTSLSTTLVPHTTVFSVILFKNILWISIEWKWQGNATSQAVEAVMYLQFYKEGKQSWKTVHHSLSPASKCRWATSLDQEHSLQKFEIQSKLRDMHRT